MNEEDKKEMIALFNQGFEQVVVPRLQELHGEISVMKADISEMKGDISDMKETLADHSFRLDRIERKLDATIRVQDEHGIEIKKAKKHIGLI